MGATSLGRADQSLDDDRPFAEIRRSLHDVVRLLSLHRWMFFVPFCAVSCGAFIGSFYLPRTYRATTSFEVRNDPVMSNLPMSAGAASYKFFRKTMVRDLTSADSMAEVVENLGLVDDAERDANGELTPQGIRTRDSLARSLGSNLSISTVSASELVDVVKITYTGPDPTIGKRLVDEAKRTYIRRTGIWIHEFLVRQRDYFLREAEEAGAEVLRTKRDEIQLRLDNPHVNPTDPGEISVKLAQLEAERRDLLLRRREYQAELNAQRQLLAVTNPQIVKTSENVDASGGEFISLEALAIADQIQHIRGTVNQLREKRGMTDQHPKIKELVVDRRRLEQQLARQRMVDRQTPVDEIKSRQIFDSSSVLSSLRGEQARFGVQIVAQTGKIKEIDISLKTNQAALEELRGAKEQVFEKQEEFADVLGSVKIAKQRHARISSTLEKILPAIKALEQNRLLQFSEGQPARGGSIPISPKASTILLLSLVAGLAVGAVFVVLAEVFDHVYRSSGQVARSLGLPLLEAIDEIVTATDRRRYMVYHAVVSPILVILCLGLTGLTGSMAYLSITQPWTYERIRSIPNAALDLFYDTPAVAEDAPPGVDPLDDPLNDLDQNDP